MMLISTTIGQVIMFTLLGMAYWLGFISRDVFNRPKVSSGRDKINKIGDA
jgi:hypothetical protein